jgi:hypothetical protein
LDVHVGAINILLAEYGLETMGIASERVEAEHMRIREMLDDTRAVVGWIRNNILAQGMAVQLTNSMLLRLFDMVFGDI